jgi:hypothetical protein
MLRVVTFTKGLKGLVISGCFVDVNPKDPKEGWGSESLT